MLPKRFRRSLIALLVAPALAVPAAVLAAGDTQRSQQQQSQQIEIRRDDMRASQMTGMDVRNPQGEALGEVKDVVIDARTGEVAYIALAHGGFLGMGEDLHAYPVKAFELGEDYWTGIDRRFGEDEPASAGASTDAAERSFVRASKLTGRDVQDRNDNDIGEVEDLVVNVTEGHTRFAVIDTAGDDTLVPVKMDALSVRADGDELVVRFEKDRMDLSRAFSPDEWPEELRSEGASAS